MKNCKMAFTIGLVFAVMMLVAACTDSNKSDNHIFDHESLDVDEYVYPSDFDLGDDLKGTNSGSDAGFEELSAIVSLYNNPKDKSAKSKIIVAMGLIVFRIKLPSKWLFRLLIKSPILVFLNIF